MNLSRNLRGTNEFGLEVQENVRNVTGIGLTNQNGLTIIGCREMRAHWVNIVLKFLGEGECGMITIVIVQRVLFVKKTDFPVNHLIMIFFFGIVAGRDSNLRQRIYYTKNINGHKSKNII